MLVIPILAIIAFAHQVVATGAFSTLPEQLFLDIGIQEIVDNTTRDSELFEPWASDYVELIRQERYGDAIWARYHMVGDPGLYAEALSFYAQTSSEDTHVTDVLGMLQRIGQEDAIELEKRYRA
ncbi:hypothetical protein N7451_009675 [Penicillium sp. IBT 35674x]|nr:hypothetical protein N7451_009675 [Penicillium sp. IBT 35674x]